ncbi:MASE4 domain-containing protein [Micromonospora sp. NPDC049679]|uniref:sensor histidine kinase n=1 Tax=Micromonospora sp. NPDC049679 TaxID=3155920 RepID=UPI0033E6EA95
MSPRSLSLPAARVGRAPLIAAAVTPLVALAIYTVSDHQLGSVPAFLPAFLAIVFAFDLLTAFLLLTQFLAGGTGRLLVLACAYLWSAAVIVPHALVFPGLFAPQGLLGATPSSSPWLWTAWHVGFPLLIGAALAPWPGRYSGRLPTGRRRVAIAWSACSVVIAAVAATAWLVTAEAHRIPVIIQNGDFSILTHRFGAYIIGANLVALALAALRFRGDGLPGLEAWAIIAVCASCGDVVLTLIARVRSSAGWYGARVLALVAALVVLAALLREITLLYQRVRRSAVELTDQNAQLQHANALRDHLVAVVSHELRNPLTAAAGFVEILEENHRTLSDTMTDELLGRTAGLLTRMSLLTEDLLTVSTRDSGRLDVSPVRVGLAAELRDSARSFPGATITIDCPDGLALDADPLRLQQMVCNYIRNAIKYGAQPVELSGRREGDVVRIRVRDHGAGVPAEFVPQLFERFSRADAARTSHMPGSGLGLSIVATLATAHGGRAWYDPTGPGACFVIDLPAPSAQHEVTGVPSPR